MSRKWRSTEQIRKRGLYGNVGFEGNQQGTIRESKEEKISGKKGKQEPGECIKVTEKTTGRRERKIYGGLDHRTVVHPGTTWLRTDEECSHGIGRQPKGLVFLTSKLSKGFMLSFFKF